ncbi:MAG: TetR/AcrR family transcriptional regulator [Gammaproteobacteria bacterium]|nr:TetR/AcrR family transcriptional regulator [Gammaproteobacteria bacterium]
MARGNYQSARQLERRRTILAATREILNDSGYDGLTIRGLAKQAGVAPATLYNLYGGKDDLLIAALDDLMNDMAVQTRKAEPGIATIIESSSLGSQQVQRTPNYARAMTQALLKPGGDERLVDSLYARNLPLIREHLVIAIDRKEILENTDVELFARHIVGQQWGAILLWVMGLLTPDQFPAEANRILLTLLASRATPKTAKQIRADLARLEVDQA